MSGVNGADTFDLADLKRRVEAARELEHRVDGRTFSLRYPGRFERERLIALSRDAQGRLDERGAARALVVASLIRWSGVVVRDAHPESKRGDELLPFDPETVALLLDEQADWCDAMFAKIASAWRARDDALEAARKNSEAASSGSAAVPDVANSTLSASAH